MTDGNLKLCDSEPHVKNSNRLLLNKEPSHHSKRQDKQALAVYDTHIQFKHFWDGFTNVMPFWKTNGTMGDETQPQEQSSR